MAGMFEFTSTRRVFAGVYRTARHVPAAVVEISGGHGVPVSCRRPEFTETPVQLHWVVVSFLQGVAAGLLGLHKRKALLHGFQKWV